MKRVFPLAAAMLLVETAWAVAEQHQADIDTRNGIPAAQADKLPKTGEHYRALQQQLRDTQPAVQTARQHSETLSTQAANLRRQLIDTATHVQILEAQRAEIGANIGRLSAREATMSRAFMRDRARVSHLLAVLERLQTDLPPAVALEPVDALKASRGTMILGSWLPRIYGAAATLSRQLKTLQKTRAALFLQRRESAANAAKLAAANIQLERMTAAKEAEASGAAAAWQVLQARFDAVATQASDLKALLDRVSALRGTEVPEQMLVISARGRSSQMPFQPGSLAKPVVGPLIPGDPDGVRMPGVEFLAGSSASVVAPADSQVLFAGPYHKSGQVLILKAAGGYDLVLAGLERLDVRSGDRLLAGEPVGWMPRGAGAKLYFELRRSGKGISPLPWMNFGLRKKKT